MIKLLQLKAESNQRDYRTSDLAAGTTSRSSKTEFSIARKPSYTGRIQSHISDHIARECYCEDNFETGH